MAKKSKLETSSTIIKEDWKEIAAAMGLSADHAKILQNAFGGIGASSTGIAGGNAGNIVPSGIFSAAKGIAGMVGTAVSGGLAIASQIMPSIQDAAQLQLTASRANFAGFTGNAQQLLGNVMQSGSSTGTMDAANAMSLGQASGITPGLASYKSMMGGVAEMSNLVPGMGLAGGMQANIGLQQGKTVNALRMAGINVRDSNGNPRSAADIFKEFYSQAVASSGKGRGPSKEELAQSMLPGNAMSNMLDQFFGANTELRQSMQNAGMQMAGGNELTKAGGVASGAITDAMASQTGKYASQYDALSAATGPLTKGFTEANTILIKANEQLAHLYTNSKLAQDTLKQLAKVDTLAADKLGQAGMQALGLVGSLLAQGLAMFAAMRMASAASGALGLAAGGAGAVATGGGIAALGGLAGWGAAKLGNDLGKAIHASSAVTKGGSMLAAAGAGAATGTAIGAIGGPIGMGAGAVIGTIGGLIGGWFGSGGSGNGGGALTHLPLGYGTVNATSTGYNAAGGSAASLAAAQIGTPYSWGGGNQAGATIGIEQGRNTVGFDCSGLMVYVFAKLGVNLPRTSQDQQRCGVRIKPRDAQPGDMLFWGEPAHHVALYIGNGKMIQAPHTGADVEMVSVDLGGVTSAARVLSGNGNPASGDIVTKNANKTGDSLSSASSPNDPFSQFPVLNSLSGGNISSNYGNSSTTGYDPAIAMSGGTTGGSGMGLGNDLGGSLSSLRSSQYPANGSDSHSQAMSGVSGPSGGINYGGVTLHVTVPNTGKIDEKVLAKELKTQLKDLGITLKVANQ